MDGMHCVNKCPRKDSTENEKWFFFLVVVVVASLLHCIC